MTSRLGSEGALYRNAGTYAVPNWVEIDNVKDVSLDLKKGKADVTTRRALGWRQNKPTLKEGPISFTMVWDDEDPNFAAIRDSWLNDTDIEILCLSGPLTESGAEGLRAYMGVFDFVRGEPLEDAMTVDVTIEPTYNAIAPSWYTVP